MDSDRILVMRAGQAAEFGAPRELLGDPGGLLSELVRATDAETRAQLVEMAAAAAEDKEEGAQH